MSEIRGFRSQPELEEPTVPIPLEARQFGYAAINGVDPNMPTEPEVKRFGAPGFDYKETSVIPVGNAPTTPPGHSWISELGYSDKNPQKPQPINETPQPGSNHTPPRPKQVFTSTNWPTVGRGQSVPKNDPDAFRSTDKSFKDVYLGK